MTQFYREAVIDSVVWIVAKSKRDQHNSDGEKILNSFFSKNIQKVYITDYILLETINFLIRKCSYDDAIDTLNRFLQSDNIEIVYADKIMMENMKEIFERYRDLSLTDCSIVALMEEKNIKHLFSFDTGFDKVKSIIRKGTI